VDLLAFYMPSFWEIVIIGVVALLLFGRRLPEVGRSLGKGIVEFKKGLKEVQDEVTKASDEVDKSAENRSGSSNKPSTQN